jgi:hypothetical protein
MSSSSVGIGKSHKFLFLSTRCVSHGYSELTDCILSLSLKGVKQNIKMSSVGSPSSASCVCAWQHVAARVRAPTHLGRGTTQERSPQSRSPGGVMFVTITLCSFTVWAVTVPRGFIYNAIRNCCESIVRSAGGSCSFKLLCMQSNLEPATKAL